MIPSDVERPSMLREKSSYGVRAAAARRLPCPVGITSYREVSGECYYVDKTLLIRDIIDDHSKVYLFTRPRRFGKTLMMDMLRTYFERCDEDTSVYFADKQIWACGRSYRKLQGRYPVIFLSFKDAHQTNWEDMYKSLCFTLREEYIRHVDILMNERLNDYDRRYFTDITNGQGEITDYQFALGKLSSMLAACYGSKTIIIIDEYDTPIQQGYLHHYYDEVVGFMRNLFSSSLKDNDDLELGILTDPSQAITGAELNQISDEDFAQRVTEFSVYARVQPEHKVRIVKAWKARGMVTAMTGDGVNDAPSIKIADIGVGMGITGTDVTKNVADMILSDDNFATIVKAAEEGRRIYDNIRRTIRFLLSSNLSEVISILIATLLGFTILKPTHLLWINLITDAFPALALGMEAGEKDIMQRPPRDRKEGIFAGGLGVDVVWQGFVIALLTLAAYLIGDYMERGHFAIENSADGMTMAFLTMSLTEMFHAFNMRRERGSIFAVHRQNWYLFGAMAFSLIATTAVIYIPALKQAFQFEPISPAEYLTAVGLAFLIIPIVELVKLFRRLGSK